MKKTSIILSFVLFLVSFETILAYTSTDVSNASFLATEGIIVKQSSASGYRLDNTITRAEVIGMALKIKGITLPNNYTCKNYFIDAPYNPINNWICRAVELAKDNGIVSGENIKARPGDPITRSEVLAMIMHAALNNTLSIVPKGYKFSADTVEWQQNIFYAAEDLITVTGTKYEYFTRPISVNYFPNRNATRAEVFGFARNILLSNSNSLYSIKVDYQRDVVNGVFNFKGFEGEYCQLMVLKQTTSTPFSYFKNLSYGISKTNNQFYTSIETGMSGSWIFFGKFYIYLISGHGIIDNCTNLVEIKDDPYQFTDVQIIDLYYYLLSSISYKNEAYNMRSPSGVSSDVFQSWYKNVTSVVFREDTVKDLGDNTYEFLVDMTENGIKSTYKVKSKVDLENFKINNISSVKQ